jgi:hypothetical protein
LIQAGFFYGSPVAADLGATWHDTPARSDGQPVADLADSLFRLSTVRVDILAGKIRDELPIPKAVGIQNQRYLFALGFATEALAAQKEP